MDSRDILIIGAVAVAAFLYYRSHQSPAMGTAVASGKRFDLPLAPAGLGAGDMTTSAASTTAPAGPSATSQVGAPSSAGIRGISSIDTGGMRFIGATAAAVVSDAIPPSPVVVPSGYRSPTTVGGAGVRGFGTADTSPQPPLTSILKLVRY